MLQSTKVPNFFIKGFKQLIAMRYNDENLTIIEICSHMGIARSTLHRYMKNAFNMSITDYLNNFRLEHSIGLIYNASLPISSIANNVGYKDPKYFTKLFKRKYGESPTSFRNKTALHTQEFMVDSG